MLKNNPLLVLDSSSGESIEFNPANHRIIYKLKILGSPLDNIKAIFIEKEIEFNGFLLKVSCNNWNGASLVLLAKSHYENDVFTETKDEFKENSLDFFHY